MLWEFNATRFFPFSFYFKILIAGSNDCQSKQGNDCIFPFVYYGNVYDSCTKDFSENGVAWCATNVTINGLVINGNSEDCMPGCPEGDFF